MMNMMFEPNTQQPPITAYSLDGMMDSGESEIQLAATSDLDSELFQQLWMQLPLGCGGQQIQKSLRLDLQFTIAQIEKLALDNKVSTMAHG